MANEIHFRHSATGSTLYATIRSMGGTMWSTAGTPNFEALTVANWANYKITMTETPSASYFYVGTFPAVSGNMVAGFYWVDIYSGSAGIADTLTATILAYWNGTTLKPQADDTTAIGGTAQTARDLGASVLLSVGTGAGQVNVASGVVPAKVSAYDTGKTPLQATDLPLPAVDTYGLGCPHGVVVSGPAWGGTFDRAARIGGRPAFYRRGLLDGIQYIINWDGADSWEAGFLPVGDTEYWLTDPSPLGEWSKPDDVVVNAPGGFSAYEGSGGYFDNYATLDVTVYAYKMVGGRTIISEVSSASVQFMDSGKAAYCSWSAVDGADGYVLHAVCPNTLNYFFDLAGTSQQVNGNEGANSEPTSDGSSPYVYPVMVVTPITAPAEVKTVKGMDADTAIQDAAAAAITAADLATSTQVNSITTNTARGRPVVPDQFGRPATGGSPIVYEIDLNLYTLQGGMETPDAAPTIHARNAAGTSRDSLLGSTTMTLIATGRYKVSFTVSDSTAAEQVLFDFTWAVGGVSFGVSDSVWITDTYAVDFTAADRTKLDTIHTALPAEAAKIGTSNYAGGAATANDVADAIADADLATSEQAAAIQESADAAARPGDEMQVADKTGFSLAEDGLPDPAPAGYGGVSAADVWASPERTLTGGALPIPPTAYTNDQDIHYTVYKNGTRPLCARVQLASGVDATPSSIAAAAYSIFLLDDEDADARLDVSGHTAIALPPFDILLPGLQTDQLAANYNFRHVPDIASHPAFSIAGRRYLVEYRLRPTVGQTILVRFRINVI